MSTFYKFDIVARTGGSIKKIEARTSINDLGHIAFVGDFNTNEPGNVVFVGGDSFLREVTNSEGNLQFGTAVQINNSGQVIANWRKTNGVGATYLYNSNNTNDFKVIATAGADTDVLPQYDFDYYSLLPIVSVNNNGESVFAAFEADLKIDPLLGFSYAPGDVKLVTANNPVPILGSFFDEKTIFTPLIERPLIADNGNVIITEKAGMGTSSPRSLILYDNDLNVIQTIASASASTEFTQVGASPGISDDGNAIAFAGSGASGSGIFVSINTGSSFNVIRIAGEYGSGNLLLRPDLGYGEATVDSSGSLQIAPIYFNSFDIDSRVGISHVEVGRPGILDDTFVVTFIGTPNQSSRNNPTTGQPLLFSDQKGLWAVKIKVDSPLAGGSGFDFNKSSPLPVVQVGDQINGAIVSDIAVYDPVANIGIANPNLNNHQIAFYARTDQGDTVVKADYLDTDGDGLLDDWEENGIDIDRDGNVDLDLRSMGADKSRKDLFMEIDWLAPDGKRDFSPEAAALDFVVDVFQQQGITLHIDAGSKSKTGFDLSRNMGSVPLEGGDLVRGAGGDHIKVVYFKDDFPLAPNIGSFDLNKDGVAESVRSFENIKDNFFGTTSQRARELAFRYVVFADYSDDLRGSSGQAELQEIDPENGDFRSIPGNDLIVSLRGLRDVSNFLPSFPGGVSTPSGFLQGQTLLHELGHTLGLRHGGQDNDTTAPPVLPNSDPAIAALKGGYKSVMSYLYQLYPDTTTGNALIRDYSSGSPFDDWSNIKLGFSDYFTTVGNSYGRFSLAGANSSLAIEDEEELTVDVIRQIFGPNALDDQVPAISSLAVPAQVSVGSSLTVEVTATDNIGIGSVTVSFDVNGDSTIDATGETVTATLVGANLYQTTFVNIAGTAGTRTVTATVADLANFLVTDSAVVTVNGANSNGFPVISNASTATTEDNPILINVLANASDPDSDPLALTLTTQPSNGSAIVNDNQTPDNPSDDFITYTPTLNFNGIDTFVYTVNDGKGGTANATVTINITPVNDAPTVAIPISNQTTTEGQFFTFTFSANTFNDIDTNDTLTYTATLANGSSLPGWLTFDTINRTFGGTPTNADIGTLSLKAIATDTQGATIEDSFTLQINATALIEGETAIAPQPINFKGGRRGLSRKGTNRSETIQGTRNNDTFKGGGGNDRILGQSGNDRLKGDAGNDRLKGSAGNDQLDGGTGNDQLDGGTGNDLLKGSQGNDTLLGGTGNDVLLGGVGSDILSGGAGRDLFGFNSLAEGSDRITDFDGTIDLIDLRSIFASSLFSGTSSFARFNQYVELVQISSDTEVRVDIDGAGANTTFGTLVTLQNFSASQISSQNFVIA